MNYYKKYLLAFGAILSLILAFYPGSVFAAVSITTATGGTNISADKAANATSPAYTTLGNIVITENNKNDISSNGTFTVAPPSGWQFNTTGVTTSVTGGLTVVVTSQTASLLTLTISNRNNSTAQSFTIIGFQVRATNGASLPSSGNITRAGGTASVSGITNGSTNLGSLSQAVGVASKLKVGTQPSSAATAGVTFLTQPAINITDQFYNTRSTANGGADNSTVVTVARGTGTATLQGTLTATASNGVSTFSNLSYQKAETINLNFTSGSLTSTTSNNIIVSAGSINSVTVSPTTTQSVSSFGTIQFAAQGFDVYNNTLTGLTFNWAVVPGTGTGSVDSSGLFTAGNAGTVTVAATNGGKTGSSNTITITKIDQSVLTTIVNPSTVSYGSTSALSTTGGSGIGAVTFSAGASTGCSVSSTTLNVTDASGNCSITATKAGDSNYTATTSAPVIVTLLKANQSITFNALPDKALGSPDFEVSATANSGLTVAFNSQTSGVCTVSSSTVHLLTTGTCTIRATQTGNTNYNGATPVDQSFSVTQSATKFVITDATNGTIDLASLVTIQAQNSSGDLVTGYQQDVTLVVPSPATGGGLVNIVNGVGTTTVSDDTIETITLSLSDTEDTNLDVSSTKQVSFGPGETAQLTISAASTTEMVAGTLLPLNISRRDRLGNSVTAGSESYHLYSDSLGSNKKFYDAESGGNIVTEVLIPNNSSSATVWYYDDKVGTPEITVSDSFPTADGAIGVDDDSMNVTVTGASTASLTLTDPGNLVAGERLAYELSRQDQFGNPSNNGALTIYLYEFSSATSTAFYNSASGGDEISSLIMGSGVATSSFWLYGDKAESFSITASDNGSSPDGPTGINDISDNVSIVSGPVSALTLSNPGDAVVGSRLGYVFTRVDSFGNPVTAGTMFVYFSHDDAVGTSTEFFDSEYDGSPVSSFLLMESYSSGYVWLYASGVDSYNVTVSDSAPADGSIGVADAVDPVTIFATPIVATRFVILDTPSAIAGDTTAITIQAQDGVGNLDTTYSGSVVLHTSGSATPGGLVSVVGGVGSINIIDTKAETINLSLSDGSGLDVSSVNSVSFLPGPTNQFLMAGNPSSLAGERVSYSITREDQYANPVTSGTENVYLYSNAPVGTGHFYNAASDGLQISFVSILNGLAGTTVWFAGTKAGDWIVDASDNLLGPDGGVGIVDGSSTLSVSPAATSRLFLNDPGDMFNGTRLGYTAERLDAYNNSVTAGSATYYLYSSAPVGTSTVFYPTLSGGAPITNLTFGDNQATANFWYYETKNGVWTVYLSDNSGGPDGASGLVDGEDAVIVSAIPIVATKFMIVPAAASSLLGNPVTVVVRSVNNSNDIDTTYQNDVTLNTSGSATGGGLVNIVNGVGQMIINDNVEETVHLTLSDTASTSLDVSSSENIIFSRTVSIPSGGGGGGGTIAPTV